MKQLTYKELNNNMADLYNELTKVEKSKGIFDECMNIIANKELDLLNVYAINAKGVTIYDYYIKVLECNNGLYKAVLSNNTYGKTKITTEPMKRLDLFNNILDYILNHK